MPNNPAAASTANAASSSTSALPRPHGWATTGTPPAAVTMPIMATRSAAYRLT